MMKSLPNDDEDLVAFACKMADAGGEIARRHFRTALSYESKGDGSPVTVADRAIEATFRQMIGDRYPEDGILGEEQEAVGLDRKRIWVVDPIDGTKSFMSGMPTFGSLIAAVEDCRPRIGIIDMPVLAERWVGINGSPTTMNGEICRTRSCTRLADAILYCTSPDIFDDKELARFEAASRRSAMRRFGGDCYSFGLLASGQVDAVIEADLKPFDYLPLVTVVEGAGGTITDWQGRPLDTESKGQVLATATPELHAQILDYLRG